jgi:YVTN family beta-propeller protein
MLCFPTRLVLGLICWVSALIVANSAHATLGDVVAEYSFPASSLVMSPTQPLMYATIPSQNSVAIINTNTLAVENTVFVGSRPVNLAFSPDSSKAYIANSTTNFVVVFNTHTRTVVIVRAIGPELSAPPYDIPNALDNPTLELHDNSGALIASNDNWRHTIIGGIITSNQVRDIINSGYAPSDTRESAIIADLPAGKYTAILRGVNNTTGVALVEVYDLDKQVAGNNN